DDTRHLEEVEKRLAELTPEKGRLEAQLQGQFPWYVAQVPKPSAASQDPAPVRSAKVKVLTCTHDGADTRNYVYFRTGGHKYLLGTPDRPLSGAYGLQEFPLDLERGPLTQDGLRGWAVGMLARPEPQGAVPDRWHPRRILVEIDGRVVYDSEENDK